MTKPQTMLQLSGRSYNPATLTNATLLVIDVQEEYRSGVLALPAWIGRYRKSPAGSWRARGRRTDRACASPGISGGLFDPQGFRGQIMPEAAPLPGEPVVAKRLPNAFSGTELHELLQKLGRLDLIVCGFMTHSSISTTVRAARITAIAALRRQRLRHAQPADGRRQHRCRTGPSHRNDHPCRQLCGLRAGHSSPEPLGRFLRAAVAGVNWPSVWRPHARRRRFFLFQSAVRGVKPMTHDRAETGKVRSNREQIATRRSNATLSNDSTRVDGLSDQFVIDVGAEDELYWARDGVQDAQMRKLKAGQIPFEGSLDLHGMTVEKAREQLWDFIAEATRLEVRCVRVTHGKAARLDGKRPLIKSHVNTVAATPTGAWFHVPPASPWGPAHSTWCSSAPCWKGATNDCSAHASRSTGLPAERQPYPSRSRPYEA